MTDINLLAVLAAAVSCFVLGGLWYSPLMFMRAWSRENLAQAPAQRHPQALIFGLSGVYALVAALVYAWLVPKADSAVQALAQGLGIGLLAAASFGINYLFSNRSFRLFAIDGGNQLAQYAIYGLIIGLWH